jgi:hypothetical protein
MWSDVNDSPLFELQNLEIGTKDCENRELREKVGLFTEDDAEIFKIHK